MKVRNMMCRAVTTWTFPQQNKAQIKKLSKTPSNLLAFGWIFFLEASNKNWIYQCFIVYWIAFQGKNATLIAFEVGLKNGPKFA